jgi:hypothetical protein
MVRCPAVMIDGTHDGSMGKRRLEEQGVEWIFMQEVAEEWEGLAFIN